MLFMSICDLFRVEFSKFKIFKHFEVMEQKEAKYEKNPKFVQILAFFTMKLGFFGKLQ